MRLDMVWTLLGNLAFAATQWSMLVILARLGSTSDVGLYTLALAIPAPIFLLLSLQLRSAQATESQSSSFRFGHYFTLRVLLAFLALGLCGVYAFGNGSALAPVIGWLAVGKLFDGLSDVCYGHLQSHGRLREVSRSLILRGLLSAALLGAAFALTRQVSWAAFGAAAGYMLGLVLYDLPRTRRGYGGAWWSADWPALIHLTRLTWPLGVAVGLIALNASLPRYFLSHERGLEAVGVFSALSYVTAVGSMVVTALGQAATTPLSRLAEQAQAGQPQGFWKLFAQLLLVGTVLGVLGVLGSALLGRVLLRLLYGAPYAQDAGLFTLLMGAAGVSYVASFAGFGMTALRQFGVQVPLFLLTTAALVLGCWLLIPGGGVWGAAWAMLGAAAAQLLGSLWIVFRTLSRVTPSPLTTH